MPAPTPLPPHLLGRPFLLADGLSAGLSREVLRSSRFRRLHRRVYVHRDVELTLPVRVAGARLVLPPTRPRPAPPVCTSTASTSGPACRCASSADTRTRCG